MKNYFILFAALSTILFSCKKETSTSSETAANEQLQASTWKVTAFALGSTDTTAAFTDFAFNFRNDGTTTAANNLLTVNGDWGISPNGATPVLTLNYNAPEGFQMFAEISGRWTVIEHSSTRFVLNRTIADNGGQTDALIIEKI